MNKLTKTIAGVIALSVMLKTTVLVAETQMNGTHAIEFEQELFSKEQHPEAYCLALNIYYESRSDNIAGMAAVSDVVLNRVESTVYPNTVCDVIKQAKMKESWKTKQFPDLDDSERKYIPIRNRCQFSWFCDGKADKPASGDSWNKAQTIAYRMLEYNYLRGISEGATHYHATYVDPKWNDNMLLVGRIGLHIFYVQR
jgi:spore germination cell wall hydrolase CwlJ-like protein